MKYKVGDKIKIRTWDDMEAEYGLRHGNCVDVPGSFSRVMEDELPEDRVVKVAQVQRRGYGCQFAKSGILWYVSPEMIEWAAPEDRAFEVVGVDVETPTRISHEIVLHPKFFGVGPAAEARFNAIKDAVNKAEQTARELTAQFKSDEADTATDEQLAELLIAEVWTGMDSTTKEAAIVLEAAERLR